MLTSSTSCAKQKTDASELTIRPTFVSADDNENNETTKHSTFGVDVSRVRAGKPFLFR